MAATTKPILAITMGDPAGVGPEVILRAWPDPRIHATVRPFVVGHPAVIQKAVTLVGGAERIVELKSIDDVKALVSEPAVVPVVNVCSDDAATAPTGVVECPIRRSRIPMRYSCSSLGPRKANRRARHRTPQQIGPACRRPSLPRPHRIARRDVRRTPFRNDALLAARRFSSSPSRFRRGTCHASSIDAQRVFGYDHRGDRLEVPPRQRRHAAARRREATSGRLRTQSARRRRRTFRR